jgi:Fe-S-cluster containining protein
LEYFFLLEGYNTLENEKQVEAKSRAQKVCLKAVAANEKGITLRLMCPLNFSGLCILYAHRPMLCRLHGIPHELHRPGQSVLFGPGCHVFTKKYYKDKSYFRFDRTPFYVELAELEKELRRAVGMTQKITMTIAQMIIEFGN